MPTELVEQAVADPIYDAVLAHVLDPWSARLAARADITAWVCVTDRVALAAQHYLRCVQVRRRIVPALAGFDDRFEAFLGGITSYSFNGRRAMAALLAHVLRPEAAGRSAAPGPLSIDGTIVERASTRPGATRGSITAQAT